MALFDITKNTRELDAQISKKANSFTKVKKSNTIVDIIKNNVIKIDSLLGKYKDDYVIIQDESILNAYINKCLFNGIISIDTETTGLNPMEDKLVGICIYTPGEKAAYIPVNHIDYVTLEKIPNQLDVSIIKPYFDKLIDTKVIMFNAAFDIRVLRHNLGTYLDCYWDCYLAARVLNENEPSTALKPLHEKYVLKGEDKEYTFNELFDPKVMTFDHIPIQNAYIYAAHDAVITYELYEFQKQYLSPDATRQDYKDLYNLFMNIEMPCLKVVVDMEDTGVMFDFEKQKELTEKYNSIRQHQLDLCYAELEQYKPKIEQFKMLHPDHKLSDPLNLSSPLQLAILLYDILKINNHSKKSPRGTGKDILENIDLPLCKLILDYRTTDKLVSTFIDKLPLMVNKNDGRIHAKFNQYGADTGRFSSNDPNLQNIPARNKDVRQIFKATDGYILMSSDYSQQEPKVMCQLSGDKGMLQAYIDGKDIYSQIAAVSFNRSYEHCLEHFPKNTPIKKDIDGNWIFATEEEISNKSYDKLADGETDVFYEGKKYRAQAKTILLGILYGRGSASIAEQLNCSIEEAEEIKSSVFKKFPAIQKFEQDSINMAKQLGYVTTLWGRKRRLPNIRLPKYEFSFVNSEDSVPMSLQKKYSKQLDSAGYKHRSEIEDRALKDDNIKIFFNSKKISEATRQCVNSRIQGSASDMTKIAMIAIHNNKRLKELGFRILIPVHDELIGECPIENAKECKELFAKTMSECAADKLKVPISCDVECSYSWYGETVEI